MKKNDILRVRVDVATLAALQRACADSGCSLSHFLRESIVHELARRGGKSGDDALPGYGHPTHAHRVILGTELEATGIVGPAVAYMRGGPDPAADGGRHSIALDHICTT